MTQKELHDQRLVKEAQDAVMRMHTRRHFLKESAMGLVHWRWVHCWEVVEARDQQLLHQLPLIRRIRCCLNRRRLPAKQEV